MNENDTLEVSKSQRKREAQELLDVAKDLISMPESRLQRMPLDDDLRREIEFARNIRPHGARKRQLLTVGKMLRNRDVEPLLDALEDVNQNNRKLNARHHLIEAWRDKLIEGSDQTLSGFLELSPASNAQTMRQLIRNARKEAKAGKPPAAARKLFKLLRESDAENTLPAV